MSPTYETRTPGETVGVWWGIEESRFLAGGGEKVTATVADGACHPFPAPPPLPPTQPQPPTRLPDIEAKGEKP